MFIIQGIEWPEGGAGRCIYYRASLGEDPSWSPEACQATRFTDLAEATNIAIVNQDRYARVFPVRSVPECWTKQKE